MNISMDEAISDMKLTTLADVKDIYLLSHNIVERLRRNRDRLRHILGGDV